MSWLEDSVREEQERKRAMNREAIDGIKHFAPAAYVWLLVILSILCAVLS
jgi:hypothetical protein